MRHGLALAVIGTLLATSPLQAQEVLLTDNFDSETLGVPSSSMNNWDITGTVDVVASGAYDFPCSGGSGRCVDLDGTGLSIAGPRAITTKSSYSFLTGDRLRMSFALSGNRRSSIADIFFAGLLFNAPVSLTSVTGTGVLGGISEGAITGFTGIEAFATIPGADGFTASSIEFVANFNGNVKFQLGTLSADNIGPIVDDVVIERFAASVPEPSSLALLGLGFAGLVASRRRRVA